jgi:hypothetical protein
MEKESIFVEFMILMLCMLNDFVVSNGFEPEFILCYYLGNREMFYQRKFLKYVKIFMRLYINCIKVLVINYKQVTNRLQTGFLTCFCDLICLKVEYSG